jgi:hypothetical protein
VDLLDSDGISPLLLDLGQVLRSLLRHLRRLCRLDPPSKFDVLFPRCRPAQGHLRLYLGEGVAHPETLSDHFLVECGFEVRSLEPN